jgi:hypothetical protein
MTQPIPPDPSDLRPTPLNYATPGSASATDARQRATYRRLWFAVGLAAMVGGLAGAINPRADGAIFWAAAGAFVVGLTMPLPDPTNGAARD